MPSSMFLKSHTVWIRLLIEMLSFIIDEDTPCAWSHIIIAVDHATALQLIIYTCCSYVMWLDTLHWRNVLTWNIITSLNDITGATARSNVRDWLHGTRLLDKTVGQVHRHLLHLMLLLQCRLRSSSSPTTTSTSTSIRLQFCCRFRCITLPVMPVRIALRAMPDLLSV